MKTQYHSWNDVSINLYYEIVDIVEDETLNETDKDVKLLSLLFDVPEEKLYDTEISKLQQMKSELSWLNDFNIDKSRQHKHFVINDSKYDVNVDLQKFTAAQYIDFQTFWQQNDLRKFYGNILATFIIPHKKKYANDYDTLEFANLLREKLSIVTANELIFFFLMKSVGSTLCSLTSLEKLMMKQKKLKPKTRELLKEQIKEVKKVIGEQMLSNLD